MELLVSLGIFVGVALAAIGLLLALKFGIDFLKVKIGEAKFNQVVSYVELAVRAAEQLGVRFNYTSEEKKALVLGAARKYMAQIGIDYDEDFLEALLEGAVQKMNAEFAKLIQSEFAELEE